MLFADTFDDVFLVCWHGSTQQPRGTCWPDCVLPLSFRLSCLRQRSSGWQVLPSVPQYSRCKEHPLKKEQRNHFSGMHWLSYPALHISHKTFLIKAAYCANMFLGSGMCHVCMWCLHALPQDAGSNTDIVSQTNCSNLKSIQIVVHPAIKV